MRSYAALLVVTPMLACFADGGGNPVASSVGATDSTTVEGTSSGAGPSSTSDASAAPTTDPTSTSSSTTTTTTTPTTGAVDNCQLAPECAAGAVEVGAQCDSCGVQRRTCQADCTWTPMACELDLNSCAYWVLPTGEQAWQRVAVDPAAPYAPKETVLAAIGLPPQQQIYVLTANDYHVLSTATRTWTASGPRGSVFPELIGQPLYHASSITTEWPDTIVNLVAGTEAFAYTYIDGAFNFVLDDQVPCCGPHWETPDAPPDPYAVRDGWSRLDDPEGWIPGDVQALCGLDQPTPIFGYSISIGDGWVYPSEVGYCFDFFPPIPFDQFPPFTYPGRPDNNLIGGAALVDGLWIFRGE